MKELLDAVYQELFPFSEKQTKQKNAQIEKVLARELSRGPMLVESVQSDQKDLLHKSLNTPPPKI